MTESVKCPLCRKAVNVTETPAGGRKAYCAHCSIRLKILKAPAKGNYGEMVLVAERDLEGELSGSDVAAWLRGDIGEVGSR